MPRDLHQSDLESLVLQGTLAPEWDSQWIKDGLVERVLDPYLKEAAVILHTLYRIW